MIRAGPRCRHGLSHFFRGASRRGRLIFPAAAAPSAPQIYFSAAAPSAPRKLALLKFYWNLFIRACPRYRYDTSQFPHGTSRRGKTIPLFFRPVQEMATVGIMERVDFPWPPTFYETFLNNSRPGSLGVHSVFLFGIQMKFHSNIPGCSRCSEFPPAALHTHHIPASLGFVSVAPSAASRRQSSPGPCRQWSRVVPRKK